jgi:hypothetical protein
MISILIPSRNEPYLQRTIQDIREHAETDIEILTEEDPGIGQRALTNKLCKQAKGEFVFKVDAHCSFSQGFDRVLLESMDDKTIMAPYLLILDAERWEVRNKPTASRYYFDRDFVMQYDTQDTEMLSETMCLQGSAWMISRENYWKWNVCDESYGSWGSQAVELGIQAYLNGGRCVTNKNCYYGHLFRTKDEDFPYERDHEQMRRTNAEIKRRFEGKIDGLIEKFNHPGNWKT